MFLISQAVLESFAPGEGELVCVLDETVATRADDKGSSSLDAVLHHHVCRHTACVEGNPARLEQPRQTSTVFSKKLSLGVCESESALRCLDSGAIKQKFRLSTEPNSLWLQR